MRKRHIVRCQICSNRMSARQQCQHCGKTWEDGINLSHQENYPAGQELRFTWARYCKQNDLVFNEDTMWEDYTAHVIVVRMAYWEPIMKERAEQAAEAARIRAAEEEDALFKAKNNGRTSSIGSHVSPA